MAPSRPAEHPTPSGVVLLTLALLAAAGCGADAAAPVVPSDGALPADVAAGKAEPAPQIPDDAPLVAFLGDSVAAGLHLGRDEAFPAVLQRRLAAKGLPFRLVNAGVSGSTTAAGLARVDWVLEQRPDVVVIELGANDGFRGIPLDNVEQNVRAIVARVQAAGAQPLLLGVRLPPNYGSEYAGGFDTLYPRVAEETDVPFVPYFMEGVAGVPEMNLADGIHPTPEGHRRLADNLEQALSDVLRTE